MKKRNIVSSVPSGSIINSSGKKSAVESVMRAFFAACAAVAVFAVISMTLYMLLNGLPGIGKVGWREILFQKAWKPTAAEPSYGIFSIILTSLTGTLAAVMIGVPAGILTAVYLAEISDRKSVV